MILQVRGLKSKTTRLKKQAIYVSINKTYRHPRKIKKEVVDKKLQIQRLDLRNEC